MSKKIIAKHLAISIAIGCAAYLGTTYLMGGFDEETPEWPYSAVESAEDVSLSEFRRALEEEGTDRRIAVLPDRFYLELEPGAGDAPVTDQDSGATAREDDAGADSNAEETLATSGEADVDEADAKNAEESAGVISVEIPYPNSPFVNDMIREDLLTSSYDVEIFSEPYGMSGSQILSLAMQGVLMALIIFILVRMTGLGSGAFGTEPGFQLIQRKDLKTGLKDVAGLENVRGAVEEIIALLKDKGAAGKAGGRLPRGLLLDGPPGTGKTLVARAMAKEADVSFISVDASSLNQMFVGLGSMKIRRVFRRARKEGPCIVFIDEIDAMGRARGGDTGGSGREGDNTLNALLTELDGFEARDGIFVVAATNRAEILDPALTRPGRIDRKITMTLPDINAREAILAVHTRKLELAGDVDLRGIAATAYQTSGAQLENLVNEAALAAGRDGRTELQMRDFTLARDRLLLPQSSGNIQLLEDERRLTAVHEAGHAVVALLSEEADPVEKVTITPQGAALGFVLQSPDRDRVFETKARLMARLAVAVAGREAEQLVLGPDKITTGAASDIRQATAVARAMVTAYGMSDLGFVAIDPNDPTLFDVNNSPSREIAKIITESMEAARATLQQNRAGLDRLTAALLETETLSGEAARDIIMAPGALEKPAA